MTTTTINLKTPTTVGIVSTYPPTRCGIARFTASHLEAIRDADPDIEVHVARIVDTPNGAASPPVTMEFDPASAVGLRAAARHLNRLDLAIISHEFGIFGPDDGEAVVELAMTLDVPAITVLHTVLPEPTARQLRITRQLAEMTTPVVLCRSACEMLVDRYGIDERVIETIPHGAHWSTQPPGEPPYRKLITWGLLGPGKGLERAIEAVALLGDTDPPVTYQIVGRTHPNVVRHSGYSYRRGLEQMVRDLGLSDRIEFIDRYVSDDELFGLIRDADVVVVPYDNTEQVSSGVITEAVGIGRPVVATRFPYSEEMLGTGAGVVVDHDPRALAEGIRSLIDDPAAYRRACEASTDLSRRISWRTVGRQYSRLIRDLALARATA